MAFAASHDTAYAIGSNGTLYAWGAGSFGQLGNGMDPDVQKTPVKVDLPRGVSAAAVAAAETEGAAVGSDGQVYAWGAGYLGYGQPGQEEMSLTPVVVPLPGGVSATAIALGDDATYVIGSNGTLYAWGFGNIGDGTTGSSTTPVPLVLPAGVIATAVATNDLTGYAIGSDGKLYAWGNSDLGNGTKGASWTPIAIPLPPGAAPTAIAAGGAAAYVIGSDGKLYAWGDSGYLGNARHPTSTKPVRVSLPKGVTATAISSGFYNGYAIGSNGTLYVWGPNSQGQLGSTSPNPAITPVPVHLPAGTTPTSLGAEPGTLTSFVIVSR
jgi:alpha-tubulin suppressor-like RCC1 family protein